LVYLLHEDEKRSYIFLVPEVEGRNPRPHRPAMWEERKEKNARRHTLEVRSKDCPNFLSKEDTLTHRSREGGNFFLLDNARKRKGGGAQKTMKEKKRAGSLRRMNLPGGESASILEISSEKGTLPGKTIRFLHERGGTSSLR